jgi:hypothetical protein
MLLSSLLTVMDARLWLPAAALSDFSMSCATFVRAVSSSLVSSVAAVPKASRVMRIAKALAAVAFSARCIALTATSFTWLSRCCACRAAATAPRTCFSTSAVTLRAVRAAIALSRTCMTAAAERNNMIQSRHAAAHAQQ